MSQNRTTIYLLMLVGFLACLVAIVFVLIMISRAGLANSPVADTSSPPIIFPTEPNNTTVPPPLLPTPTYTQPVEVSPPSQPTGVPDPTGRIVFTCQMSKNSRYNQICMMNADGSNMQRLTTNDDFDHLFPSLAPDGSKVVFSSNQAGGYEIYSLDWSGNQVQLTDEQQDADYGTFAPEISPDGQWIVYALATSDLEKSIWIMDSSGDNARWLFGSLEGGAWDPSWSPDGSRILFMSDRTGTNQLHTIAVDGTDLRQVTNLEDLRGRNDWSQDGVTVATYIGTSWDREIILMNADGTNLRYLTDGGNNLAPSFSPDGQWVAITSYKDLYKDNNGCEIYIVRIDGSDMRRLTENDYCDWQPRWGP